MINNLVVQDRVTSPIKRVVAGSIPAHWYANGSSVGEHLRSPLRFLPQVFY